VVDQAATVLSEEFESMVTGPLRNVQDVLKLMPEEGPWDGSWRESDISIEYFQHETHLDGEARGVRMTHVPTDLTVETYQRQTRGGNEELARKALMKRVAERWTAQERAARAKTSH
jgi:protein subunit release factor A